MVATPACNRAHNVAGYNMNRRELLSGSAALATACVIAPELAGLSAFADSAPVEPATRRTRVLADYEEMQFGVSYHFSMNTFTGNDYETGGVPASTYNPTHLDVRQWSRVAHELGAPDARLTPKQQSRFFLLVSGRSDDHVAP